MFEFTVTGIIFIALMIFIGVKLSEKEGEKTTLKLRVNELEDELQYHERKLKNRNRECNEYRQYMSDKELRSDFTKWLLLDSDPMPNGHSYSITPRHVYAFNEDGCPLALYLDGVKVEPEDTSTKDCPCFHIPAGAKIDLASTKDFIPEVKAIGPEGATLGHSEHTLKELSEQHHEN